MPNIKNVLQKAQIMIGEKKLIEANSHLDEVLLQEPNNAHAYNLKGIILGIDNKHKEAINFFKKSLNENPSDPLVIYNLACSFVNIGNDLEAIKYFEKANNISPNKINIVLNYGKGLFRLQKYEEALKVFLSSISYNKNSFELNYYVGLTYKKISNFNDSLDYFNKAISINNKNPYVFFEKGYALIRLLEHQEAIISLKIAISLNPNFFQAYNNLGLAYKNIGLLKNSLNCFEKAIELNPRYAEAYYNLGNCYELLEKLDESKIYLKKAIELNPNYWQAFNNLGTIFRSLGKFQEAEKYFRKSISLNPNFAEAYNNLGLTLKDLTNFKDAESCYQKAIKINPAYAQAYYNLAFTLIYQHNFEKGFELFEWRWKTKQKIGNEFKSNKPLWRGEPNKNILVWKEQGIGDEIMFGTLFKNLYENSKNLIIFCDHRLIPLFKRSLPFNVKFIDNEKSIINDDYDVHLPIGSMPFFFRKDIASFQDSPKSYIKSDDQKTSYLKKEFLSNSSNKIVGISWFTKSPNSLSSFRNINLQQIATLLASLNFKIVNLQYGDTQKEIQNLKNETGIEIINIDEIDKFNDIDGLASLISACDLVVSTTNVTVHLSASLGKDTRVLLPINPDARWGIKGKRSYWYKSVQLYRQTYLGDWTHPLNELKDDLYNMSMN